MGYYAEITPDRTIQEKLHIVRKHSLSEKGLRAFDKEYLELASNPEQQEQMIQWWYNLRGENVCQCTSEERRMRWTN